MLGGCRAGGRGLLLAHSAGMPSPIVKQLHRSARPWTQWRPAVEARLDQLLAEQADKAAHEHAPPPDAAAAVAHRFL